MLNYITASFKAKEIGYVKSIVFVEIDSFIEVEEVVDSLCPKYTEQPLRFYYVRIS